MKSGVEIDSMKLRKLMLAGLKNDDIKWQNVLKLQYNNDKSIEDTIKYIENCKRLRKNLDDFDDNKEIIKNIQDTEVGWIDREGKSYGFKSYMPGQNNHIILADKICKELNEYGVLIGSMTSYGFTPRQLAEIFRDIFGD